MDLFLCFHPDESIENASRKTQELEWRERRLLNFMFENVDRDIRKQNRRIKRQARAFVRDEKFDHDSSKLDIAKLLE